MSITASVGTGAVAPEAFVLTVTQSLLTEVPSSNVIDLSTVSAAAFFVRRPDLSTTTWTVVLSAQTTTSATLTHTYDAGGGDVALPGVYGVYAKLTIPSGVVRTVSVNLTSQDPFTM